ncbi:MAG: L,D-transpeptidase family protein [Actinomycetes bacterium]
MRWNRWTPRRPPASPERPPERVGVRLIVAVASLTALVALPVPGSGSLPGPLGTGTAAAAPGDPSAYVALPAPSRLLDTRVTGTAVAAAGRVPVRVTGAPGLPDPATTNAVVLNVTVVGPARVGFWTVFPTGLPMPTASNLNVDERWALLGDALAMPNLVTVPVGPDGTVTVYSQRGGHVVVDMLGSYQTSGATAAGRLQPLARPERIFDSRNFLVVAPGSVTEVRVPAALGAAGASAAVLNVTVIGSDAGYWTVFPAGTTPPLADNLNSLFLGHVSANQAIVPLDADGDFSVFSQSGGHLVIDVVGLVTGPTAPVSTAGLFVPLAAPTRFLDTRTAATNPLGRAQMPLPGWNVEVGVTTDPAIGRTDVAALAMNVTATESLADGYVSVTPAGSNDPADKRRTTSSLNLVRAAQTLPNHTTVAVSARGFDVFTQKGTHLIADVAGYYLGTPVAAPFGPPANQLPTLAAGCLGHPGAPVAAVVTGSGPANVARGQQRLLDLGFWLAGADGSFGVTTRQAVMAFQKWSGLPASGNLDEVTAARLNTVQCRPTTGVSGDLFLVDKGDQLGFIVRNGRAEWVLNVSTGGDYDYTWRDSRGNLIPDKAVTPTGTHRVYRVHDEPRYDGSLGVLYRPRFFVGGVAVHGAPSVPNYPASHGCVRVTNQAMDMIWATDAMPMRSTVVVRD